MNTKIIELKRNKELRLVADVDMKKDKVLLIKEKPNTPVEFVSMEIGDLKKLIKEIDLLQS